MTRSGSPNGTGSFSLTVACPLGKQAIGGGAFISGAGADNVALTANTAVIISGWAGSWRGEAREIVETDLGWTLTVQAICATLP